MVPYMFCAIHVAAFAFSVHIESQPRSVLSCFRLYPQSDIFPSAIRVILPSLTIIHYLMKLSNILENGKQANYMYFYDVA